MTIDKNELLTDKISSMEINLKELNSNHFREAFPILLEKALQEHEQLLSDKTTFNNLFYKYKSKEKLMNSYGLLSGLISIDGRPEFREVQEEFSDKIISLFMKTSLDKRWFDKLNEFQGSAEFEFLDSQNQKMIVELIKDLKKEGINMSDEDKVKLSEINIKINDLRQSFEKNLTGYTQTLGFSLTKDELGGLSERVIESASALAKEKGIDGYWFNHTSGLYDDLMLYSSEDSVRKRVYEDLKQKGSAPGFDNREIIKEIYNLNQEKAKLLGFKNYAVYSTSENMAKTPEAVLEFVESIANKAKPAAKEEFNTLTEFGKGVLNKDKLDSWDMAYVREKYKEHLYTIDQEDIRQYFPVEPVIEKTLNMLSKMFDVEIKKSADHPVWAEGVSYYEIFEGGKKISSFYLDPYQRENKMPGAWVQPMATREVYSDLHIKPVAFLACNNPINKGGHTTFEFDEVVTLFHELGHLVHHCLTKVDCGYFSGFGNVQHDAIEFPSQLMENFAYEYEVLRQITSHVDTGKPIEYEDYLKINNLKTFMNATTIVQFAIYSEMDMNLYNGFGLDPIEVERKAKEKWRINPNTDMNNLRMPQFSHIFGGGYEAGYYGYQWAEVLSLDALNLFSENFSDEKKLKEVALSYKKNVLERGGLYDMEENFRQLRGRAPDVTHYLVANGIKVDNSQKDSMHI